MSNITDFKVVPLSDLMTAINRYKFNPSNIQRVILDHLADVTNGLVDIVDPTNPFVFLLESSSVNTASAILENEINLRKQYPALSQLEDEVYAHMSDRDFVNRFATPSTTRFSFLIQYQDLLNKLIDSPEENCKKITILRNTTFTVNDITFSIQYPINIRQFYNGVLQISYDNSVLSPLQNLTTNIIDFEIRQDGNRTSWLYFEVDVTQFTIKSAYFPIQASMYFHQTINFTDSYYYCRVYYMTTASNKKWIEILTTHSDQVYDPFKPTAVLRVVDKTVTVFIPPVYINNQLIDGNVRIDVYETKGELSLNMSNFTLKAFSSAFKTIDEENDITVFSNAMNDVSYIAYSDKIVSGGTPAMTFDTLREQVIYNAIGDHKLPITNIQLEANVSKLGFGIVKNVDNITNRIFLATRNLPKPLNSALITPANITIDTIIVSLEQLALIPEVRNNGNRITLPSSTLYKNVNGKIALYPKAQVLALKNLPSTTLAENVNTNDFLYSPYYYVLDNTQDEFDVRPYHLDAPNVSGLNFVSQNPTAALQVNTSSYSIEKLETGYRVITIVKSDTFYKGLDDQYISAQLAYIPTGENNYAYINGSIIGRATGDERIFEFVITTNFDIDNTNELILTNFKMFNNEDIKVKTPLLNTFKILYTTNSVPLDFVPDAANSIIGKFILPNGSIVITEETIKVEFGKALKNLWSRSRSVAAGLEYSTYLIDVEMRYEEDVYQIDPNTGSIFTINVDGTITYNLLHRKGDYVYDENGDQVFKHRKGDVVLDDSGKPVSISSQLTLRHIDLMFVDGIYYFTTDSVYTTYRSEVSSIVSTWVTDDLADINSVLLEQTKLYYYPKRSIGLVSVMLNNDSVVTINASQSFVVDLYVRNAVYRDTRIRDQLRRRTIEILDTAMQSSAVAISDIIVSLKDQYGSSVVSAKLTGLGGNNNYETVTIINDSDRLSLKKRLVSQEDGSLIVEEDVTVNFIDYELN